MASNLKNWSVLLTTMLVTGAVVLTALQRNPGSEVVVSLLLRLTAFASFLIFLLVFVARPLRQLWRVPLTGKLLKNRRYAGIVFAGVHFTHLALIVTFVPASDIPVTTLIVGGIAYLLLLLMLITSFDGPAAAIGPVAWRRLHKTGLYWIGSTFTITLTTNLLAAPGSVTHQVLLALLVIAVGLRIIALRKRLAISGNR